MHKVLIVQAIMKQYREPFFRRLWSVLAEAGVELTVAYGQPHEWESQKADHVHIDAPWALAVRNRWFLGGRALWQPLALEVARADLVIVEHANKHLLNWLFLPLHGILGIRIAFWGHGRNRQRGADIWLERLKRASLKAVDGWFAYTKGTKEYLVAQGVPEQHVTVVQNAIDVGQFAADLAAAETLPRGALCEVLGVQDQAHFALFCGALYRDKEVPLLVEAFDEVHRAFPEWHLLVVGGGPEQGAIERMVASRPYVHMLGPLFGSRKAIAFKLSEVFLHPGCLGLAVLDAFAAGLPVVTTEHPGHGPEVEYLSAGTNGEILPGDPARFAHGVIALLGDEERLESLRAAANKAGRTYTLEAMVQNFAKGVLRMLDLEAPSPTETEATSLSGGSGAR